MRLRLLTWNVRALKDDRAAVVRVLQAAAPDLACLQEVPRWPGSTRRLALLAADAELVPVAGGRSSAGTAMLRDRRLPVTAVESFRFARANRQPRGAVLVTVGPPVTALATAARPAGALATAGWPAGTGLRVCSAHLGLNAAERLEHVRQLLDRLGQGPAVLAGDLNEPPAGPAWRALAARLPDPAPDAPFTYPARAPRVRIDAILTSADVRVIDYAGWQPDPVDALAATDHLPVLATLEFDSAG